MGDRGFWFLVQTSRAARVFSCGEANEEAACLGGSRQEGCTAHGENKGPSEGDVRKGLKKKMGGERGARGLYMYGSLLI